MKKVLIFICVIAIGISASLGGLYIHNKIDYAKHKIDDSTNYETIKKVEDTCRSMISSYNSDSMIYDQYKDSEKEEENSWAEQAKMRANTTASNYNNYILKNSYVWKDNIPSDIVSELAYIK